MRNTSSACANKRLERTNSPTPRAERTGAKIQLQLASLARHLRSAPALPGWGTIASFHNLCPVVTGSVRPRGSVRSASSRSAPSRTTHVQPILFTTAHLPPHQQFGAFRAAYEAIHGHWAGADCQTSFAMSQRIWPLGRLVLTSTSLPKPRSSRPLDPLPEAVLDHWYVMLPCRFDEAGPGAFQVGCAALHPLTGAAPHHGDRGGWGSDAVRAAEPAGRSCLDTLLDVPLATGLGTLLADLMLALDRRLPLIEPHDVDHLVEATRCLLIAARDPPATIWPRPSRRWTSPCSNGPGGSSGSV